MNWFPLIRVDNVMVLPGIPSYVRAVWEQVRRQIIPGNKEFHSGEIYLKLDETVFAKELQELQGRWEGRVEIGSYPETSEKYRTKLTIDSEEREWVEGCLQEIRTELYPAWQVDLSEIKTETTVRSKERVDIDKCPGFSVRLEEALSVVDKLLIMYREEEICIAFNGGKDCTVLIDLVKRSLSHPRRGQERLGRIILLYIRTGDTFPEIEAFIRETSERNRQSVVRVEGDMREGLVSFSSKYPRVRAILMGTRSLDPHSDKLHHFQSTDRDWPNFLRVMPILAWRYRDVWTHLRGEGLPYCPLYDRGYTSVGEVGSTQRNPALRNGDSGTYRPAYQLEEETREREGRVHH